jgi:hypothetical protein
MKMVRMGRSLSLARVSSEAKGAAAPADTAMRNKRRRVVESGMADEEYRPEIVRELSVGDDIRMAFQRLNCETSAGMPRETTMSIVTHNKRLIVILLAIACVLLLPAVAMRFTDEVSWTWFDFGVAGGLLLAAGLTFEFFARRGGSTKSRVIAGIAIAAVLVVVWLELAVGIFGSPLAGS